MTSRPTTIAAALTAYDAALQRCAETQARLDNILDLMIKAERKNAQYAVELREAHNEIAGLISERDTWRAATGR